MLRRLLPCACLLTTLLLGQAPPTPPEAQTPPSTPTQPSAPPPPKKIYTTLLEVKHRPHKHQGSTNTCWAFGTTSFLESEILRKGKGDLDLSIMYTVRNTWPRKADMKMRLHGSQVLSPGGQAHDVIDTVREHGLMPMEVYTGLKPEAKGHNHAAMEKELNAFVNEQVKVRRPAPTWKEGLQPILDQGLGEVPQDCTYNGKTYTPQGFLKAMGIDPDDYVELTSYTHQAFYKTGHLDVVDNWSHNAMYYNVPLDELQAATDYALKKGYSVAWDGGNFRGPSDPKTEVNQGMRQEHFDDFRVGDDHLMHLVGLAKDQDGVPYYKIKDSYGTADPYGGYRYMNIPRFRLCTVCLLFNKHSLPPALAKKLGLQQKIEKRTAKSKRT